jgi:hypothetical protein
MLPRLNKLVVATSMGVGAPRAQVEAVVSGITEIGSEGRWDAPVQGWG